MHCRFQITTAPEPRLLARVPQLLISNESLALTQTEVDI
jgi:hypothetical protein